MTAALDERRSSPRLPLGQITLWAEGVAHVGRGDVSLGGCFWKGDSVPQLAETTQVSFALPGLEEAIRLPARVLHRRHTAGMYAVHMEFFGVPEKTRVALREYADGWFEVADASGLLGIS